MKTAPLDYERDFYSLGIADIAGIDEVGRGSLAGPVVACAVVLPPNVQIVGVNDSKAISAKKREQLASEIKKIAVDYCIAWVAESTVDKINILQATYKAMYMALAGLKNPPHFVLIDGVKGAWQPNIPHKFIKKGDTASHSIAAASILAKTARDDYMCKLHEKYPQYGFASNKGYGTAKHTAAIRQHGCCPLHRQTFLTNIADIKNTADTKDTKDTTKEVCQ
ncbi:MAG: ribonuclease HII [Defluviitaleaceae bacterium]|nr:ribonuclease HII [Defluviitaleaceae bacterium]